MQQSVLAVVTRAVNYRDSDRVLTLLTRDDGCVTASARGCRNAQSKLLACSQQFCYGEYELYERQGHLYVRQCDLREIFYDIRRDTQTLSAADYACKVCELLAVPGESFVRGFSMLLHTLKALCERDCDVDSILAFFMIKQMSFAGFYPQADACVCCDTRDNLTAFSHEYGGAVCVGCQSEVDDCTPVPAIILKALAELPNVPSAAYEAIHSGIKPIASQMIGLLEAFFLHSTGQALPRQTMVNWQSQ